MVEERLRVGSHNWAPAFDHSQSLERALRTHHLIDSQLE